MKISGQVSASSAKPQRYHAGEKAYHGGEPHAPGLIRDTVEKAGGAIFSAFRIPTALLVGAPVGGHQGYRKGKDPENAVDLKSATTGLVVGHGLKEVLKGVVLGLTFAGPAGAALYGLKELGESSAELYLYLKGGSANEMAEKLVEAVDSKVEGGEGRFKGAAKGALAGMGSTFKSGARTGYMEGLGAVSGLIDGLGFAPEEFEQALSPRGNALRKAATSVAGTVAATLALPAGVALGAMDSLNETTEPLPKSKIFAATAASGAISGGLVGTALGGPVGAILGAAVGAGLALLSRHKTEDFAEAISQSVDRARKSAPDLGHEITNKRRDLVQSSLVGGLSAARQGWNAAVK